MSDQMKRASALLAGVILWLCANAVAEYKVFFRPP